MLYLLIEANNPYEKDIIEQVEHLGFEFELKVSSSMLKDVALISQKVSDDPDNSKAIFVDLNGIGPFLVSAKHKHVICAMLNDEQSALMTRDHNNTNTIAVGSDVLGLEVMKNIITRFLTHNYAGGRHQIRIDMLKSMIEEEKNA